MMSKSSILCALAVILLASCSDKEDDPYAKLHANRDNLTEYRDYRWYTVAIGTGNNNFFPLRLFRTSYYRYESYNNANDNYNK